VIPHHRQGTSFPLGATVFSDGVNFSVFSRQATRIELLLCDGVDQAQPSSVIELEPRNHRTYRYWRVFVPGSGPGQLYAYRAFGPYAPEQGLRFPAEGSASATLETPDRGAATSTEHKEPPCQRSFPSGRSAHS
jgi:pullulanase/glycogen debranching enzyme